MKNQGEMSFLGHLEVLRRHIIRMAIAVIIFGFVAFFAKEIIFDDIIFAPKNPNFVSYRALCEVSKIFNMNDDSLCITELPFTIQSRTMAGQFSTHLWSSVIFGFIIAFPYIVFELWRFISPALYEKERKYAKSFIFISSFLFFLGVLFGYYIITPLSINFLGTYQISEVVLNEFDLSSYMELVATSVLSCGIVFELPIIIYFLTKIGLVNPTILRSFRKYALILILIVAAIITPPDIASQVIVSIPILILYEISIFISAFVVRKQNQSTAIQKTN